MATSTKNAVGKAPGRKHPVHHSTGPVRTPKNTRSLHVALTAKNAGPIGIKRGVRTVANSKTSGLKTPNATNQLTNLPTTRSVRAVPNNARSL